MTPASDIRGSRILLVEDNTSSRLALESQLDVWHCRTGEAACGEEALTMLLEAVRSQGLQTHLLRLCAPRPIR